MKKHLIFAFLFLALVTLNGCSGRGSAQTDNNSDKNNSENTEEAKPQENEENLLTIDDYYPYKADAKYVYEGEGNEYASYVVYTDYIAGDRIQLRSNNSGTETIRVFEKKDGALTLLLTKGECYYRDNLTQTANNTAEILLKEPLKKGNSWVLPDQKIRTISNINVEVSTPMGNFTAIEVTTQRDKDKTIDYYAPDVGLIKSVFISGDTEISSTLYEIENNTTLTQNVRFFYPNVKEDKIYYTVKKLEFHTNDITRMAFLEAIKELPEGDCEEVLNADVKINSLYLNADGMVYVDFSKDLTEKMNAGSGYESMILQCITNTLGNYYDTQKVYITVEGNPYVSGHFEMQKGEPFMVDMNNCYELEQTETQ